MNSLNGGYAMIKYNSTQEELQIAYRSKKPVLCYDENRRAHWAVIEETATESVDEETQEPITIYEYSYRLIDEASGGVSLYMHVLNFSRSADYDVVLTFYSADSEAYTYNSITAKNLGVVQITGSFGNKTKTAVSGYIGSNLIQFFGSDGSVNVIESNTNITDYVTKIL